MPAQPHARLRVARALTRAGIDCGQTHARNGLPNGAVGRRNKGRAPVGYCGPSGAASVGVDGRGVKIPGNAVLMVFRNDYAVRMLEASVPAGIEAPLRIDVTENDDATASLTYRKPSAVFAPYRSAALDAMARELDILFDDIVRGAAGG